MSDQLSFVQFPHRGVELGPDAGSKDFKRWDPDTVMHGRKFMVLPGAWRESPDDPTQHGEVAFWGEWEAGSSVSSVDHPVIDGPQWLHSPHFAGIESAPTGGAIRQNTDPFVFGDRFLYTYCRQPTNQKLRELADGSLILFGSKRNRRFVLDTVFVVASGIDHARETYVDQAAARTNDVFRLTTLEPMYQQGTKFARLYLGATAEDPVSGMFSFTPCMPARDGRTFARPAIDLPRPFIKPNLAMQAATIPVSDPADLKMLWDSVVDQVIRHGCSLGVAVALPERRSA